MKSELFCIFLTRRKYISNKIFDLNFSFKLTTNYLSILQTQTLSSLLYLLSTGKAA
jgi:hypothetical protein